MKCRVCGYDLDPNRAYCDMCGTRVIVPEPGSDRESRPSESLFRFPARPAESFSREADSIAQKTEPPRHESEFSWNVYDFPKPKQPRDIPIQWPDYDHPVPRSATEDPSEGKLREAIEKKQPVVMVNSDVSEGFIAVPDKIENAWTEPMAESTKQAEKFFTFQKKNEEFQRLLDQEYEKLKNRKKGESYTEEEFRAPREDFPPRFDPPAQAILHARQPVTVQPAPFHASSMPVVRAGDLSDFERMLMENTRDADFMTGDTLPINLEKIQEEVRAQEEARTGKKSPNQERIEAMARAREEYFRSIGIEPDEEDEPTAQTEPAESAAQSKTVELAPQAEPAEPAPQREIGENSRTVDVPAPQEARTEAPESPEQPEEAPAAEQPEEAPAPAPEQPEEAPAEEQPEEAPAPEPEQPGSLSSGPPKSKELEDAERYVDELFAPVEEAQPTGKKKKKHRFLRFLMVLVLIAGLAEASVIGMRQLLPEHEVTKTLTDIEQTVLSEAVLRSIQFRDYVVKVLNGLGIAVDQPEAPEDPVPQEEPVFDLGEVVSVYNKNIRSVTESPKLGFDSTKTYEIEGLGEMGTLADIETKEAVYGCLISYNSKWIDYVNTGEDRSCLDLLKTEGEAYRSAVNFSKVGKIRETFDSLVLGEIRSDGDQYFAFVREQITVEEGGESTKRSYSWIYRLEDVAGDIKIVDYAPFE